MNKVEEFVLGQHLSYWGDADTYESIVEAFESGECPDSVAIWYVYEDYPTEEIAGWMEGLRRNVENLVLDCGGDIDG